MARQASAAGSSRTPGEELSPAYCGRMSRGRRSAVSLVRPSVAPAPNRWWGDAGEFIAANLAANAETDPVSRAVKAEWAVVNAVRDAITGRDFEGARELVRAWREATPEHQWELAASGELPVSVEQINDADLERQARILDAASAINQRSSNTALRAFGREEVSPELEQIAVEHLGGDEGERAWAIATRTKRGATTLFAETAQEIRNAARAVMRIPEAYPIGDGSGDGQELVVTATESAAHELFMDALDAKAHIDMRLVRTPRGREADLSLYLRTAVMTPTGPLALTARVNLERTGSKQPQALRRIARERLRLLGWERGQGPAVEEHGSNARLPFEGRGLSLPERPASELVGHDFCRHADAHWAEDREAVVLRCDACRRERIAVVPAHRLPAGHPVAERVRSHEEAYLRTERARAAIHGRTLNVDSIDDLRAQEGVASLDQRHYLRRPRQAGRHQSLRGALAGR